MTVKIIKHIKKSKQGSLILMSILILSGIISAASAIGVITLQNLRQGIAVNQGLTAYYAAESGVEDALYEIRKSGSPTSSLPSSASLSNGASWSRTVTNTVASLQRDIAANDTWSVELYDAGSSLSPLATAIKSVRLSWTGSGSEWIEAQIVPWDTTGTLGTAFAQMFSSGSNPAIINLQDATNVLYRLRIKALYAPVNNMTITAFSALGGAGTVVPIPSQITILSTGSFSRSRQALRATMLQRTPLADIFGYVLFSEQDLIKP